MRLLHFVISDDLHRAWKPRFDKPSSMLLFHNSFVPSIEMNELSVSLPHARHRQTNPFQTARFRLSFEKGLQFVRQCTALLRLCFFYNLQANLEGGKSKFRYFWRI